MRAPSSSAASGSSTSMRRPVRISSPPRACSARAIACPRPPVAPVSRTVEPEICMGQPTARWTRVRRDDECSDPATAPATVRVIALFGPTGVGKTARRASRSRGGCARGGRSRWRCPRTRCRCMRASRRSRVSPARASGRSWSTGWCRSCRSRQTFSAGQYAKLAHAEIDGLLAAGRRPIVVGGTGLYLRAALTELDMRPPPARGRARALDGGARAQGRAGAARAPGRARAVGRAGAGPERPPARGARAGAG